MRIFFFAALMLLSLGSVAGVQNTGAGGKVPVFQVVPLESAIKFGVDASVKIQSTFEKWDATLTFASADNSRLLPRGRRS